ncbi:MAG: pilus assembly protein PilY [Desulfuromonadaceae bacterium]|nr:pilus assembly protein PilY [Desulfuromonadaceae bacterium]
MKVNSKQKYIIVLLMLLLGVGILFSASVAMADNNYDLGAWYGDNNTTNYYSAQPNGSGGGVQYYRTSSHGGSWENMSNRDRNAVTNNYDTDRTFRVNPDTGNNYQIKFIKYARATGDYNDSQNKYDSIGAWTDVSVSTPTASTEFTITSIRGNYVIWVVFEKSNLSASYTVTASVYQEPDATSANYVCNSSSIYVTGQNADPANPQVAVKTGVANNNTASFSYTPASGCEVDSVQLASAAYVAYTSNTYVTPAVHTDLLVSVKFRKISLVITSSINTSSPSGSGTINPLGSTPVAKNGSQTFTISPTIGYRIVKVEVTDTQAAYSNKDLGPITTYTFNNVTANGTISVTFAIEAATTCTYCLIPPFVAGQSSLIPNVLIDFDNSGSMAEKAYQIDNATYSSGTTYTGYFDNSKMYTLNTTTKTYSIDANAGLNTTTSCANATTVACSGNRLNFDRMTKVDVVKKVLVGGKTVDRTAATKYLILADGYKLQYGTAEPTGIIQALSDKVRFGLMLLNGPNQTGELISKLGDPVGTLVTAIEGITTGGYTPLAHTLYEAIRYYEANHSAYGTVDYGTIDPIQYACQKHFVLVLTDGVPNNNDNLPGSGTVTDSDFNVNTWIGRITDADKVAPDADGQKMAAVAYYAHNSDLRSATVGKSEILGVQNVSFYTVYTFGKASEMAAAQGALKVTAKYGGYENTNGNGSLTYASPDLTKEWDKDGNGVPDNYFAANQGDTLQQNIMTAMSGILAKVASGTAASILSNSEGSGANLLQAVFFPNKIFSDGTQVDWTGEMQNLWYYVDPFIANSSIREDTDFESPAANPTTPNHILNLKKDYAVRFYFANSETSAEITEDVNGDGVGDVVIFPKENSDDVKSIFRAGKQLRVRTADSRTIQTSIDGYSLLYPTTDAKGGFYSATTRATDIRPYLQAVDLAESQKIINYIRGTDQTGYRSRKVALTTGGTQLEWKLGDIVASTPRLQASGKLNSYNLESPVGYGDKSYDYFVNSSNYKARGMVYVGANDGMLHAFKLGKLTVSGPTGISGVTIAGDVKATLTGANLGEEQWAYIPRAALPYLKYFTDIADYKHLFYVDGQTVLLDAAVKPCAASSDYAQCVKPDDSSGAANWRTLLIGSMGLGGASRPSNSTCTAGVGSGTCVKTPIADPTDTATPKTKMLGYSSYFMLDITGQYFKTDGTLNGTASGDSDKLALKWEFPPPDATADIGLGYSTSGAAIVRIMAKKTVGATTVADKTKNGKWFAVFASGPTGPIETVSHSFYGKSDQNLKLFVVDLGAETPLVKDTSYWVIDTGIRRAFGGSMLDASIDTDRWNKSLEGNYQDDALYLGYTKANIDDGSPITATTSWTDGGVIRLLTKEDPNPANWVVSTVISGIGPVTSGIKRLQDRKNKNLWLYFGTGRFYFGADDSANTRQIVGLQDACYTAENAINKSCSVSALTLSDLENQTTPPSSLTLTSGKKGWYVNLDGEDTTAHMGAERNITDPVALTNGMVVFTTFKPTSDVCQYGGSSYLWALKYDTGGSAPPAAKDTAKVLVQVSTGAFEEVALGTALTASGGRKQATAMTGKPPTDAPPVITNASNKPPKKILHLQEK